MLFWDYKSITSDCNPILIIIRDRPRENARLKWRKQVHDGIFHAIMITNIILLLEYTDVFVFFLWKYMEYYYYYLVRPLRSATYEKRGNYVITNLTKFWITFSFFINWS